MSTRKPRADASRNRALVLDAARSLFAVSGDAVQLPDVARAAGVGIGTVYRHFPTRQDLVEAAAEQRFEEIAAFAQTCASVSDYLTHVGTVLSTDRGLSEAIETARRSPGSEPRGNALAQLQTAVASVIARDQTVDCTVADVYMLVGALSAIIRTQAGDWHRFIDVAMHGIVRR